jgi:PLP dependent protein
MTDISGNLKQIRSLLPDHVKLIAVSKTRNVSDILEAYNLGQRRFGENRVQELLSKKDLLPKDIEWHIIGHLQSNKVKFIAPFIGMIESVDSVKLLKVINSEAEKAGRNIKCLLQVHIAEEETKFGFGLDEIFEAADLAGTGSFKNLTIAGVMGMATFTDNHEQISREFASLAKCFRNIKAQYFKDNQDFREISMGMSGDFKLAIDQGSTMLRIGSSIFGERK